MRQIGGRLIALMFGLAAATAHAGTVSGTVVFEGEAPVMREIDMGADPVCVQKHAGKTPPKAEALVLGEGQTMANVFVCVVKGLPVKDYPVPKEPAVLNQTGCIYTPHVFVVRAGQPLKVINPDGTLHNVNGMAQVNEPFNKSMNKATTEIMINLPKPEGMFPISCQVHPWMRAYCAVLDHPFYDITGKDGKFEIMDLPEGEYVIEAWHERLGVQSVTIRITEGVKENVDFTFSRPSR